MAIQRDICMKINDLAATATSTRPLCTPSLEVVGDICRGAGHPDFLVFAGPLATPAVAEWHDAQARAGRPAKSYYLYSCATLR